MNPTRVVAASQIGLQARLLSQALRKLSASAAKSKTTLIFINQLRNKVGSAGGNRVEVWDGRGGSGGGGGGFGGRNKVGRAGGPVTACGEVGLWSGLRKS